MKVCRSIVIFILFTAVFFSLPSMTSAANPVCETTTGTTIQQFDNNNTLMETSTLAPNSTTSSVRVAVNNAILSVSKFPKDGATGKRGTVLLSKGHFTASAFLVMRSGVTLEGTMENGKSVTTICTESRSEPVTIKILESQVGINNLILDGKRKTEDTVTGEPRKYYVSQHRGIQVTSIDQTKSTDNLVSTYPTTDRDGDAKRIKNIIIEDVQIIGYEGYGIYLEHVDGVTIKGSDTVYKKNMNITDIGYAGIGGVSANNVTVKDTKVSDIWPGVKVGSSQQSYGMAFSHRKVNTKDDANAQAKFPPSNNIVVDQNVVANNPTWEGIDTHSGQNVSFTNNVILNTRFPIVVGGMDYNGGKVSAYPPRNITISGNRINSHRMGIQDDYDVYDIEKNDTITERGITVNGTQFTDLTKMEMGFLDSVVIKDNYVSDVRTTVETQGGISIHVTKNAIIEDNTIENSFNNGIVFLSSNKFTKLHRNKIQHVKKSENNYIQAGIGIRGSHNNGNFNNDYTTLPLTLTNTLIENDHIFTEVGREIHFQVGSESNLLNNRIGIPPDFKNQDGFTLKPECGVDTTLKCHQSDN
ncbi:right-handed parallel beta-helix repeat-containing protein [Peribacillus simplex]|uniref:right-handed parallel beta-helix repeat-containing protein n=1 Tax=Peribacillus simplex TaxID=1478 RepID=UPI00333A1415